MEFPSTYIPGWHDEEKVKRMEYRRLGNTDMIVSKVGIGGSVLGGCYDEGSGQAEMTESIIAGLKSGLNMIDTAPFYGVGRSETKLGEILKDVPRAAYYIATKVGRYSTDWKKAFDFSRERILAEFDNSLKRLNLLYVDLLQVHDIEFAQDNKRIATEVLAAVEEIRNSGRARYIGITGYCLSDLKEVVSLTNVRVDTILSYSRNIFLDKSLQDYVEFFKSKRIGIINASPTGLGLLTNRGPPEWHPASKETKAISMKASEYCIRQGVELGKLSVHYTIQDENIGITHLGFGSMNILRLNLEVVFDGLSEKEQQVSKYVQEHIFTNQRDNWEGVELAGYRKALAS